MLQAIRLKAAEILPAGSRVVLYGSRARGDSHVDSDWDLHTLFIGSEKLKWDLYDRYAWPFCDIGLEFDEIVNPRLYSVAGWEKRNFLPFYKNVEREKIIIFQN